MNDAASQIVTEFHGTTNAFLAACRSLLSRIAYCPANVIAKQHPLGFIHFTVPFDEFKSIRLHIWPPLERHHQGSAWPIHDHNFTLLSRVVLGEIENSVFDVCPTPQGDSAIYYVTYADGTSILTKSNINVAPTLVHRKTYEQGMIYNVEKGIFHTSTAQPSKINATIVIASPPCLNPPRVVGPLDGPNMVQYQRTPCSDAHKRSLVEALLENLPEHK